MTGQKEMAAENWSGWVKMENSRKWHYFASGDNDMTSLCGKFMMLRKPAIIEEGNDDSPDNCSACRRKLRTATRSSPTDQDGGAS